MIEPTYVTVFTWQGINIQTLSPAGPGQFGYVIDLEQFINKEFTNVQNAVDAIDSYLGQGNFS